MSVWSSSEEETKRLGGALAEALHKCERAPLLVSLKGDLGAGKSAFARGVLMRWLLLKDGTSQAPVMPSPTYTIAQVYGREAPAAHLDLYRLKSFEELEQAGGVHYFHELSLCLVEWLDQVPGAKGFIPQHSIEIEILGVGAQKREIRGRFLTTPEGHFQRTLENEARELFL